MDEPRIDELLKRIGVLEQECRRWKTICIGMVALFGVLIVIGSFISLGFATVVRTRQFATLQAEREMAMLAEQQARVAAEEAHVQALRLRQEVGERLKVKHPEPGKYPQGKLLIEPAELTRVGAQCILDVRKQPEYQTGHIPGATWVDVHSWDRAFANQESPGDWKKRLESAGIDPNLMIVIYGDDVRDGARVWWLLRYWGAPDVRLLNGGWPAWKSAGGKESAEPTEPQRRNIELKPQEDRLATKQQLLSALKEQPPLLVDARSRDEHGGQSKTAKRNGKIPGAIHLEWVECLDPQTRRFKPPEELARLLAERKIDVNASVVTYCQSGGRAAVVAFTLELMGGKQVKNYYKSWSEWGNAADTPIEETRSQR